MSEEVQFLKVFNDPVHGHIELPALCVKVIDTPEFQRLRDIKKLGGCYWVYPGASHNVFEHSIGICHLAGSYVVQIRHRQPELGITDLEEACVELAGLTYNIGQGPLSNVFSENIVKSGPFKDINYSLEIQSWIIVERILSRLHENGDIEDKFCSNGGFHEIKSFVKELILGPTNGQGEYTSKTQDKLFLFEIVRNRRSRFDVINMDSLARDCYHLGMGKNFDHNRMMKFARVINNLEGKSQICHRDKETHDMYEFYHTYREINKRSIQHKVVKIIEFMFAEAFSLSQNMMISCEGGKSCKLGDILKPVNLDLFICVTDSIFNRIEHSQDETFARSRNILRNINERKLYKFVGSTPPENEGMYQRAIAEKDPLKMIIDDLAVASEDLGPLKEGDLIKHIVRMHSAQEEGDRGNPVDKEKFYTKATPNRSVSIQKERVSMMIPDKYSEFIVRFYCKSNTEGAFERAKELFDRWV